MDNPYLNLDGCLELRDKFGFPQNLRPYMYYVRWNVEDDWKLIYATKDYAMSLTFQRVTAPTHYQAIEWLKENKGITIDNILSGFLEEYYGGWTK